MVSRLAKWLGNSHLVNPAENALDHLMEPLQSLQFFPLPSGVVVGGGDCHVVSDFRSSDVRDKLNEEATRFCGILVRQRKIAIYALAGLFFGMSGLLQYSRLT